MKATENTTMTIMSEKAMKEQIKKIIERLTSLRGEIKSLYIPADDEYLDMIGVHWYPESACEWLDMAVKELSGDDCLSRLCDASADDIAMAYSNIEDYIDKTEDFVPEDDADLQTAMDLLNRVGEILDELKDIEDVSELLDRLTYNIEKWKPIIMTVCNNELEAHMNSAFDHTCQAVEDFNTGNVVGARTHAVAAVKRIKATLPLTKGESRGAVKTCLGKVEWLINSNPHWKCAAPMKLFDGNMANYRYQLANAES